MLPLLAVILMTPPLPPGEAPATDIDAIFDEVLDRALGRARPAG